MLVALRRHLGREPDEGGLGQLTGESTEKSRDALVWDVDWLEHSCDVLGWRGVEGSRLTLNFGLRWDRLDEGFRRN